MYGLVNASIKQLLITQHGRETWDRIALAAHVKEPQFDSMRAYDDAVTSQLVSAASQELGVHSDDILRDLGKFWVPFTDEQGYGAMFEIAGPSLREFLLTLDTLHARVGAHFKSLRPPSFQFDSTAPRTLRMHYRSERSGLCPFVVGLLDGLAHRFRTSIHLEETRCARRGDDHCVFVLGFE